MWPSKPLHLGVLSILLTCEPESMLSYRCDILIKLAFCRVCRRCCFGILLSTHALFPPDIHQHKHGNSISFRLYARPRDLPYMEYHGAIQLELCLRKY